LTDGIAKREGDIVKKVAIAKGMVRMPANQMHGISPSGSTQFNSNLGLHAAI
jgi:hypothetical protein